MGHIGVKRRRLFMSEKGYKPVWLQANQKYGHPLSGLCHWAHLPSDIAFQLSARSVEEKRMLPGYSRP